MIFALLVGTIIGYILAIPPGPVSVSAIKQAMSPTPRNAYYLASATALMDFIYALLAIFAATAANRALETFATDHQTLINVIQIAIVVGFILYGFDNLRKSKEINNGHFADNTEISRLKNISRKGPFFLGIVVSVTNVANPTFLPSLTYLSIQIQNLTFFDPNLMNRFIYAIGFGLGNFLWLVTLSGIINTHKHRMGNSFKKRIQQFAGITFISFGTLLGYRIFQIIHWHEILRFFLVF
jgi:threonine/homoserine/homoserine lactone efflux protein